MSEPLEEVNLESGIMKRKRDGDNRRGQRDSRGGNRNQRGQRDQRGQRNQRDRGSRSRSPQRQNDRGNNYNAQQGEPKNGGRNRDQPRNETSNNFRENNKNNDDQNRGDGFTAVIKNMLATNRISEILQDIKIRAGNVKNMSVIAEKLNPRNLDETRIEIHVTFYTAQSRDECISQYNEANLDDQVLQCYKL